MFHFQPYGITVKPHFMTTRKSNNKHVTKTSVRNAAKTAKQSVRTFNAVTRSFQESKATALGRELLQAMNTLGVHVPSLANLKTSDIFTAWWGGLKTDKGNLQIWKSTAYLVEVNGEEKTLYSLLESGDYRRVSVYTKKFILSETDKNFDKKTCIYPTTDVVVDGLVQCSLSQTWTTKVAKAAKAAEALTEGYVNLGTAQKPQWTKVIRKDGRWLKATAKAA